MQEEIKSNRESEEEKNLSFETKTKTVLAEIGKWGKFVGIVGFAFCGILLIAALALIFLGGQIGEKLSALGQPAGLINSSTGFIYAVIAILYYFPSKYVYDFSVYMQQAVQHNDQESIDYSFDRLKALFKFMGIVAIILIGFYGFAILLTILSSIFGSGA